MPGFGLAGGAMVAAGACTARTGIGPPPNVVGGGGGRAGALSGRGADTAGFTEPAADSLGAAKRLVGLVELRFTASVGFAAGVVLSDAEALICRAGGAGRGFFAGARLASDLRMRLTVSASSVLVAAFAGTLSSLS